MLLGTATTAATQPLNLDSTTASSSSSVPLIHHDKESLLQQFGALLDQNGRLLPDIEEFLLKDFLQDFGVMEFLPNEFTSYSEEDQPPHPSSSGLSRLVNEKLLVEIDFQGFSEEREAKEEQEEEKSLKALQSNLVELLRMSRPNQILWFLNTLWEYVHREVAINNAQLEEKGFFLDEKKRIRDCDLVELVSDNFRRSDKLVRGEIATYVSVEDQDGTRKREPVIPTKDYLEPWITLGLFAPQEEPTALHHILFQIFNSSPSSSSSSFSPKDLQRFERFLDCALSRKFRVLDQLQQPWKDLVRSVQDLLERTKEVESLLPDLYNAKRDLRRFFGPTKQSEMQGCIWRVQNEDEEFKHQTTKHGAYSWRGRIRDPLLEEAAIVRCSSQPIEAEQARQRINQTRRDLQEGNNLRLAAFQGVREKCHEIEPLHPFRSSVAADISGMDEEEEGECQTNKQGPGTPLGTLFWIQNAIDDILPPPLKFIERRLNPVEAREIKASSTASFFEAIPEAE